MNRHERRRANAMGVRNVFDADSATVIKASRYAGLVVIATAATGRRRGARSKWDSCAPVSPRAHLLSVFTRPHGGGDHATGQASSGAVMALGAAGVGLSLVGGASASTMPTAGMPQSDNTPSNQRFVLSEEEMTDVSLAAIAASLAALVGQAGDVGGHG